MKRVDLADYARGSLNLIARSLSEIEKGYPEFYRVIALQLRLLLCDSTRRHNQTVDISLVPQVLPELKFHPLNSIGEFDHDLPPMTLEEWLAQPLPIKATSPVTIRTLIRQVCDQDGGAHVDQRAAMLFIPEAARWVVHIGRYVMERLETGL
ncbi:MAG: hypothetical protein ABSA51_07765 [Anaerolineaceae bacterium]|jgi:hypothetical protein